MTDNELNELVARKLGWVVNKTLDYQPWYARPGGQPESAMIRELPDFCNSIQAAWEMVEWCKANMKGSFRWDFVLECSDRAWRCGMFDVEEIEADTAPMAIALAFLKLP